jgi:choline dehydrogenase-like flavoprotein
VLNRWNQVHEVPNVFVTDGACLPSSGDPGSPSLTLMALTARAANHAAELLKDGKL